MDSDRLVWQVVRLLKIEDVIFFLGAGVSVGTPDEQHERKGLPSSSELGEAIGADFGTGSQGGDLTKAASVAASRAGPAAVKRFVAERIRDRSRDPLAAHRALARLRPPLVITTNYDDLYEKAVEVELGESPDTAVRQEDLVHLPRRRPRVVKLHGDFRHLDSLVLTGEDYLDWESKTEGLFADVTVEFQRTSCVFAGFCNEELLVEPEKLVKAWLEPMLPKIEKLKNLQDPPEVDEERLKEYEEALRRGWKYSNKN